MLKITLLTGLAGAVLMFCGDMLLYYDRNDYEANGSLQPIIDIMKKLPETRIMLGGWIGPVAAFMYCIGFYHIVQITDESFHILASVAFLLSCLGIIAGGAYHSHCVYLGLLGQNHQKKDLEIVLNYFQKLPIILYLAEGTGLLLLFLLILSRKTILPVWMTVFTPGIIFLLKPLTKKLPQGFHMVIAGGFNNLIFIVYYLAALTAAR